MSDCCKKFDECYFPKYIENKEHEKVKDNKEYHSLIDRYLNSCHWRGMDCELSGDLK